MSTAGVHIPVRTPSSRPRLRARVSSKIWFMRSWIEDRSFKGSHQRTIAMSSLPNMRPAPRGGRTRRESSAASRGDLDLFRLRLGLLRQMDLEDAAGQLGAHLVLLDGGRQREGAQEGPVR